MQSQEIYEVPALDVDKAIRVVQEYVRELEEQKPEELTEKQVTALTKSAEGLISSIQSETPSKSVKPKPSFLGDIGFSSETAGIFGAGYR